MELDSIEMIIFFKYCLPEGCFSQEKRLDILKYLYGNAIYASEQLLPPATGLRSELEFST